MSAQGQHGGTDCQRRLLRPVAKPMFRDRCQGAVLECDYGDGVSVLEQPEEAKQKGYHWCRPLFFFRIS